MRFRGRKEDGWHKNIDLTAGVKTTTDVDFPWIALQHHTEYFLKKKGSQSQIQTDKQLLILMRGHPAKEIAIAACARFMSTLAIRDFLINDLKVQSQNILEIHEYHRALIAAHHQNSDAVHKREAEIAHCMLEHAGASRSIRTLAQQLQAIIEILSDRVNFGIFSEEEVTRLAAEVCQQFAAHLETIKRENRWREAYATVNWLSNTSVSYKLSTNSRFGARYYLDIHFPTWTAWAAWRPLDACLATWHCHLSNARSSIRDFFALEGPDFVSMKGSEKATLKQGLIAQDSASVSVIGWGQSQVTFERNSFRQSGNLSSLLERLISVRDFACSAGYAYTSLIGYLCEDKPISLETLQILEDVGVINQPVFTTLILRLLQPPTSDSLLKITEISQMLPTLNDLRIHKLREQITPYIVDRVSTHMTELQDRFLKLVDAGQRWKDAATELLVFILGLKKEKWLLCELDQPIRESITSVPGMETIDSLAAIRDCVQNKRLATRSSLLVQIDTYCKAQMKLHCGIKLDAYGLIEVLLELWDCHHAQSSQDRWELALLIADLPHATFRLKYNCLKDVSNLPQFNVDYVLSAFKFPNNDDAAGFRIYVQLLACEGYSANRRQLWGDVLFFMIKTIDLKPLHHTMSKLTIEQWLELMRNIRTIYGGTEAMKGCSSPYLLNPKFHRWSQQMSFHISTLKQLEIKLGHELVMKALLLGPKASTNSHLLRVINLIESNVSSCHQHLMLKVVAIHKMKNGNKVAEVLSAVSKATLEGAKACQKFVTSRHQASPESGKVALALKLRDSGLPKQDQLALRAVAGVYGVGLDAENNLPASALEEHGSSLRERHQILLAEAQRLESLRLSLRAVAPQDVLNSLGRLKIEIPSEADDALASLPWSVESKGEMISNNEVELQFPAADLTKMQRFAMGAGDNESFLIRLTFGLDGVPTNFCMHLSGDFTDSKNSNEAWQLDCHKYFKVSEGYNSCSQIPCCGRPNRGVYQLSRCVSRYLCNGYESLEKTHDYVTAKLSELGQSCIVCGLQGSWFQRVCLRRAATCSSPSCQSIFSQAQTEIILAEIWQDPPIMDLLLTIVHAAASTGQLNLLPKCPNSDLSGILRLLDQLPGISEFSEHLHHCVENLGADFSLENSLLAYSSREANALAIGLRWACSSYRGFITSATSSNKIPYFGNAQFLVVNTAPELESSFARHMPSPNSTSEILFHGTSLDRLYAIICQGLQVQSGSALQRHGANYGSGIYMADEPSTAKGYTTTSPREWRSSKLKNKRVLLGCELAGRKPQSFYEGCYLINDATRLAVRYIFLLDLDARVPAAKDVVIPMRSVFQSMRSGTL